MNLDNALLYLQHGWFVLPLWWPVFEDGVARCACGDPDCAQGGTHEKNIGKHPLSALVPDGLTSASTDETTIRGWWTQYPDANIGVVMQPSGLLALDVDHPDGRDAAIAKLQAAMAKLGDLPPTVEQISGSGNGHLLYKAPPFPVRGEIEGITVRSRAYLVVAPSRHKSGGYYEWEASPETTEVAELPANWLAALRKADPVSDAGVPDEASEPPWLQIIPEVKRVEAMRAHLVREKGEVMGVDKQGTCFNVCRTAARGFAVREPDAVLAALKEIYNPKCSPPYSDEGLSERVQKAFDQAHTPSWGACFEPKAAKLAAFYEQVGFDPATAAEIASTEAVKEDIGADATVEDVQRTYRAKARSLCGQKGADEGAIELDRMGRVLKRLLDGEPIMKAAALDAIRIAVRFAPVTASDTVVASVLVKSLSFDGALPDDVIALVAHERATYGVANRPRAESDAELAGMLESNDRGPLGDENNVYLVLRDSAATRGRIRWNELTRKIEVAGVLEGEPEGSLDFGVRVWMSDNWRVKASRDVVGAALLYVARKHGSYNPVAEYLEGLEWDGTRRLDTWLVNYCRAQITDLDDHSVADYVSKVGAMWMIGAVARALVPGAKMDNVLVLEGAQGAGKSTAFEILGAPWFTDSPIEMGNKDALITAGSRWVCELAELASLTRSETESQKAFLSARIDNYRPPYGRESVEFKRRCVFGGTVNPGRDGTVDYLRDETGNRRWWPVRVGQLDVAGLRAARDQLWAEAVHRYSVADVHPDRAHALCPGERWWFEPGDEQAAQEQVAEQRRDDDPWSAVVLDWARREVAGLTPLASRVAGIRGAWTLEQIAKGALDIAVADLHRHKTHLSTALKIAGFQKKREQTLPNRPTLYRHPDVVAPVTPEGVSEAKPGWSGKPTN